MSDSPMTPASESPVPASATESGPPPGTGRKTYAERVAERTARRAAAQSTAAQVCAELQEPNIPAAVRGPRSALRAAGARQVDGRRQFGRAAAGHRRTPGAAGGTALSLRDDPDPAQGLARAGSDAGRGLVYAQAMGQGA